VRNYNEISTNDIIKTKDPNNGINPANVSVNILKKLLSEHNEKAG
jgi:hypothetical protein